MNFAIRHPGLFRRSATVTASGGGNSTVALSAPPVNQNGTLMLALDDLARTYGASDTTVPPGDPSIDPRVLSVAPHNANGQVYVPVVELMRLFGKTVVVE